MEKHTDAGPALDATHKETDEHKAKKPRRLGACDGCRKKKIKCDSAELHPDRCTNCRLSNIKCGHDMPRQPTKAEARAAYIQSLEQTVEKMRRLLHAVYSEKDLQLLLAKSIDELPQSSSSSSRASPSASSMSNIKIPNVSSLSQEISHLTSPSSSDDESDDPDDFVHLELAEQLKGLAVDAFEDRFFGRSSLFMFFKEASAVRGRLTGMSENYDSSRFRRPVYWDVRPWEFDYTALPSHPDVYDFPDDDLLRSLVFIYFEKVNQNYPLLHKPTFIKMLADGRHLGDPDFGMVVLMVCALASKFSHDPRVWSPGDATGLSAGWKYFKQVPMHRRNLLFKTGLFDLQYYVLAMLYLIGTSIPQNSWNILGALVRYLFEIGGHRRKPQSQKPTAEEELMKRVFWCVLYLDRMSASLHGRPCLIQDEDYDIDFPIECDDEYWDPPTGNPDDAFKQPPGKPSYITAFVCNLKLTQILGLCLRTLYATKKAKALSGMVGDGWEQRVVAELDSSMNKWKDSVPQFLQWDAEREDSTFFHQSVFMYATFYYVQIQIHRPFLMKKTPLSLPSLAMCTNAARSCASILEASLTRGMRVLPTIIVAASSSGAVITLNLWGIRHSGLLGDVAKETGNLQKCINVLKECEKRWHTGGRSCDLLKEVSSFEEYDEYSAQHKRPREEYPADYSVAHPMPPNLGVMYAHQRPGSGAETVAPFAQSTSQHAGSWARSQRPSRGNQSQVSMAHSMAITPVASMSMPSAILNPPPSHGSAPAGAATSMYNPAPNHPHPTEWDLLTMQMRNSSYEPNLQAQVGQDPAPGPWQTHVPAAQIPQPNYNHNINPNFDPLRQLEDGHHANRVSLQHPAALPPPTGGHFSASRQSASGTPESIGNTEDLLSLFSDVPMAFSLEEWDAYLANIGS